MELVQKRGRRKLNPEDLVDLPLSAIDWINDKETLYAWNAVNAPKLAKRRDFTFVQKSNIRSIIERVKQCPKWAYIKHDKDITEDGVHYHFYIVFPNPRSFCSVANDLGIPVTSLQKVLNKRGILEYLTHKNSPDKHQYNDDEVVTNMDFKTEVLPEHPDPWALYCDYASMREGKITPREFYERYSIYIVRHSFSNQLKVAEMVYNNYFVARGRNGGNLSPVPSSEFH